MAQPSSDDAGRPAPDARQMVAYFALMEATALLQHGVEQQLRSAGDLSYVQFQVLVRLAYADGPLTMTQLADGVVYSRSGLTYQAARLAKAGLITRRPSPDDERSVLAQITDDGRDLVGKVLPGHIEVVQRLLFNALSEDDLDRLGGITARLRDHMRSEPPRSAAPRRKPDRSSPDSGADPS
ncbi:MarR family winged helix-turn-helix transcriptional regulator [Georgenia faecalis]|uniref:MarR family winged helix-turn-helix transcriptional regulator n=1 Tax=Georgenia faecalis TaxID=2483799 RepID=UPI001F498C1B|nr:MarR family transcriptional regulator [Georgenia faecalis]